ncbi:MAG: hypothetical protein OEW91_06450, partial [Acidimicrobiia bacterium]|nr:hypothetical protein [Acidimicrobiia bacterium]
MKTPTPGVFVSVDQSRWAGLKFLRIATGGPRMFASDVRDGMRIDWDVAIEMDDGLVLRADV